MKESISLATKNRHWTIMKVIPGTACQLWVTAVTVRMRPKKVEILRVWLKKPIFLATKKSIKRSWTWYARRHASFDLSRTKRNCLWFDLIWSCSSKCIFIFFTFDFNVFTYNVQPSTFVHHIHFSFLHIHYYVDDRKSDEKYSSISYQ